MPLNLFEMLLYLFFFTETLLCCVNLIIIKGLFSQYYSLFIIKMIKINKRKAVGNCFCFERDHLLTEIFVISKAE